MLVFKVYISMGLILLYISQVAWNKLYIIFLHLSKAI